MGSGRLARALGHLLLQRGHPVSYLAARSPEQARAAAAFIGPSVQVGTLEDVASQATHLLIAVSDSAVSEVATRLALGETEARAALHTAGVLGQAGLDVLSARGVSTGLLHPLQTVPTPELGVEALPGSFFAVEASGEALLWAREIIALLGGRSLTISPGRHALYHAAAALAGNGVTAVLAVALQAAVQAGLTEDEARSALASLAMTSLRNSAHLGPVEALTGPVRRGDAATVRAHLEALAPSPGLATVYRALAPQLVELARRAGLAEVHCREVQTVLSEAQ